MYYHRHPRLLTLTFLLSLFLLPGCAPVTPATGGEAPSHATGVAVTDSATLIEALRAAGREVGLGADLDPSFFGVGGKIVTVDGADIQLFEFPDAATAASAAATIDATGDQIGASIVSWIEPPHIYHRERLIVIYVGGDVDLQALLADHLGAQIAGR